MKQTNSILNDWLIKLGTLALVAIVGAVIATLVSIGSLKTSVDNNTKKLDKLEIKIDDANKAVNETNTYLKIKKELESEK